jgi:hypothetical protein
LKRRARAVNRKKHGLLHKEKRPLPKQRPSSGRKRPGRAGDIETHDIALQQYATQLQHRQAGIWISATWQKEFLFVYSNLLKQ